MIHANICPHAFMNTGIHPLLNHAVTQIVKFDMINAYMLIGPSTNSKRFKLTYYAYMIAGIHPLLNHAVTHFVILNKIHSCIHSILNFR